MLDEFGEDFEQVISMKFVCLQVIFCKNVFSRTKITLFASYFQQFSYAQKNSFFEEGSTNFGSQIKIIVVEIKFIITIVREMATN